IQVLSLLKRIRRGTHGKDSVSMTRPTTTSVRKPERRGWRAGLKSRRSLLGAGVLAASISLAFAGAMSAQQNAGVGSSAPAAPTLEETRLTMGKWIETQQMISKESKDWQQGKEILLGRLE